jgi:methylmalonyl-CoA mutase N-terminal domain/subunit
MSFFFNAHNHLFEEVAKYRAARKLWAELLRERFGFRDAESCKLRFHAQTAGSMLTAQQPLVNVVRVTVQALAAVLGGTQSLHTNGYDEALGLPSRVALLALRTQQVIAHESGATDAVYPLAGSYFVEALTADLEARARVLIAHVDRLGGMLEAIASGWVQEQIHLAAYQWQRDVESGAPVVASTGTPRRPGPAPFSPTQRRDGPFSPVARPRAGVHAAPRASTTPAAPYLVPDPHLLKAAPRHEVCDAMRDVFGVHAGAV